MIQVTNCDSLKLPIMRSFKEKYIITEKDVLLDSIKVLALKEDSCVEGEINFEIKSISDELTIYPLHKADKYVVKFAIPISSETSEENFSFLNSLCVSGVHY